MKNFTKFLGRNRSGWMKVMLVLVGMVWGVGAMGQSNWNSTASSSWGTATNWSTNPTIPNAVNATASVNNNITSNINVTIPSSTTYTIGTLNIGDASNSFTIDGGDANSQLTFDITSTPAILTMAATFVDQNISVTKILLNDNITITNNSTAGSLLISSNINTNGYTITVAGAGNVTFSGVISGTGGITKTGTGTLTLSGANTFTGAVSINNGAISVASINKVASGSASSNLGAPTTVANGTIKLGTSTTSAGTLIYTGGDYTTDRVIDLAGTTAGGTITTNGTGALVFSSAFTATGAGIKTLILNGTSTNSNQIIGVIVDNSGTNKTSVTKSGAGTWVVSGNNTFTGTTTLSAGTLIATTSTGALGAGTLTISGGELILRNATGLNFARNTTVSGSAQITSDVASSDAGVTHTLGTLSIGNFTLTIAGGTNVTSGTAGITFGAVTHTAAPTYTINNPSGGGATQLSVAAVTNSTFLTTFNGAGNVVQTGVFGNGSGGITYSGSGVLTLSQANTYTGATTISSGTLKLGGAAGVIADGSALTVDGTLDMNSYSETVASLSGAGTVTSGAAGTTVLSLTGASTTTYSGIIQNGSATSVGLTVNNASHVLTLSGSSTYTGTTTITAGIIKLGASGGATNTPLGTTGGGTTIATGGTLDVNGYTLGTSEGLTLTGVGVSSLGTLINSSSTSATYSGAISVTTSTSIGVTGSGDLTLSGVVSGSSAITKVGTGTGALILNALNTFTGATTVSAGTLKLGRAGDGTNSPVGTHTNTSTNGVVVSSGAVFDLNGYSLGGNEALNISGTGISTGGALVNSSSTAATWPGIVVLVANSSIGCTTGDITVSGLVSGAFTLTKYGSNVLTLSALNTYTGVTTVSEGTLKLGIAGNGTNSPVGTHTNTSGSGVVVSSGAVFDLNGYSLGGAEALNISGTGISTNGALYNSAATAATWTGLVTLASDGYIGGVTSGDITLSGQITGNYDLYKEGLNILTISSTSNNYYATNIDGGTLKLGAAGVIPDAKSFTINSGATLDMNAKAETIGSLHGIGKVTSSAAGSVTLTSGGENISSIFLGVIENGSGTLNFALTGTTSACIQTFGGLGTYSGTTTINYGTLKLASAGDATNGPLGNITGATVVSAASNAVLDLNGYTLGTAEPLTLNGTGFTSAGALVNASSTAATYSGAITLGSNSTIGTTSGDITLSGIISGAFGITKVGASNTLTLSGANTFTGAVNINEGSISVGSLNKVTSGVANSNLGAPTTIANGTIKLGSSTTTGTLIYTGGAYTTDRVIDLAGTTGGGTITSESTGALIFSSAFTATGNGLKTLTLNGSSTSSNEVQGAIVSSTSATSVLKSGTGNWVLSGASTFTGTLNVNGGILTGKTNAAALGAGTLTLTSGELKLQNATGLSFGRNTTVAGNFTLTSDVVTAASSGVTHTLGTLSIGNNTLTIVGGSNVSSGTAGVTFGAVTHSAAPTYTVNNPSAGGTTQLSVAAITNSTHLTTFNGSGNVIQTGVMGNGAGALTYSGTGTLTLSQVNTYTGKTTVTSGKIELAAADDRIANTSNITLGGGTFSTGASVGFTETVGTLELTDNTTINLGTGVKTLTFAASNAVSWTSGKTLTITGWTGSAGTTGTAGKIIFGSTTSGLTATQLAQITFTGFGAATILSTGEIVPGSQFRSKADGNWSATGTWEVSANGTTWTNATSTPTNTSGAISISHNVTVDASVSADEVTVSNTGTITINSGQTLTVADGNGTDLTVNGTVSNAGTLTATGTIAFNAASTYTHNQIAGSLPKTNVTWNATSTCNVTGTTGVIPTNTDQTFGHFTWNCTGQTTGLTFAAAFNTVGNLTITHSNSQTLTTASALSVGGNLTIGQYGRLASGTTTSWPISVTGTSSISGIITFANATTSANTFTGNVTINSGGTWTESAAAPITFVGSLQNDGTFTSSTGTHIFSGASKTISGASATTIPTLTINGTITNNITTGVGLQVSSALAGSGTLTQGSGAYLSIGGTSATLTIDATTNTNTVDYYHATVAQTIFTIRNRYN